jgi:hypothetical protein
MNRLNPEKLRDELASTIALIDLDMSKEGTTSNIIDRAARSTLSLLMSIFQLSTDEGSDDEIKDLKEQIIKLQIEKIAQLKKGKTGNV